MGRKKIKRFVQVFRETNGAPGCILDAELLKLETKDSFIAITVKDPEGIVWSFIYPEEKIDLVKVREEAPSSPKTLKVFEEEETSGGEGEGGGSNG